MTEVALQVNDLRVYYHTDQGPIKAVDGISFSLNGGERLGLVGESGSGKTTAAFAILRLIRPPARVESGEVRFGGADLLQLPETDLRGMRFSKISLIPQGAMNSLNPVMRVRDQIADVIRTHRNDMTKSAIRRHIGELLESVGLKKEHADVYPHELSGGMKQRVCIAMAISLQPEIIVADEPTSALDVVTQRQVMETLGNVQRRLRASVILVGHDMGLMAQFVDTIGVMYGGKLVEIAPVRELFRAPLHPYTRLLISSLPSLDVKGLFRGIPGVAPSLRNLPPSCRFHPRCPEVMERCKVESPELVEVRARHGAACHLY